MDPNDYLDDDLDRPGFREWFSAWLDDDFNRAGIKPFPGTDREALELAQREGVVSFVSSAESVEIGVDAGHVFDQAEAALDDRLERLSAVAAKRQAASEGPGHPEPHPALDDLDKVRPPDGASGGPRVARPSTGSIIRPRGGTVT